MAHFNSANRLVAAARAFRRAEAVAGPRGRLLRALARRRMAFWGVIAGAEILPGATLGARLSLPHPTGVVIHERAVVGDDCMMMQQVTLGQVARDGAPTIGHGVYIGAGAKVLGAVTIGDGAQIGANAVVIADVPAGATAVGIPARIVRRRAGG